MLPEIIPIREKQFIAESQAAENWHDNISGGGEPVFTEESGGGLAIN